MCSSVHDAASVVPRAISMIPPKMSRRDLPPVVVHLGLPTIEVREVGRRLQRSGRAGLFFAPASCPGGHRRSARGGRSLAPDGPSRAGDWLTDFVSPPRARVSLAELPGVLPTSALRRRPACSGAAPANSRVSRARARGRDPGARAGPAQSDCAARARVLRLSDHTRRHLRSAARAVTVQGPPGRVRAACGCGRRRVRPPPIAREVGQASGNRFGRTRRLSGERPGQRRRRGGARRGPSEPRRARDPGGPGQRRRCRESGRAHRDRRSHRAPAASSSASFHRARDRGRSISLRRTRIISGLSQAVLSWKRRRAAARCISRRTTRSTQGAMCSPFLETLSVGETRVGMGF